MPRSYHSVDPIFFSQAVPGSPKDLLNLHDIGLWPGLPPGSGHRDQLESNRHTPGVMSQRCAKSMPKRGAERGPWHRHKTAVKYLMLSPKFYQSFLRSRSSVTKTQIPQKEMDWRRFTTGFNSLFHLKKRRLKVTWQKGTPGRRIDFITEGEVAESQHVCKKTPDDAMVAMFQWLQPDLKESPESPAKKAGKPDSPLLTKDRSAWCDFV